MAGGGGSTDKAGVDWHLTDRDFADDTGWREAAQREIRRYGVAEEYVAARFEGRQTATEIRPNRGTLDWALGRRCHIDFGGFAVVARVPTLSFHVFRAVALPAALFLLLISCGTALWRTTVSLIKYFSAWVESKKWMWSASA